MPQDSTFAVANEGTACSECCLVPSPQLFVIKSDKRLEKVIANTYSSIRPQSLHHLKSTFNCIPESSSITEKKKRLLGSFFKQKGLFVNFLTSNTTFYFSLTRDCSARPLQYFNIVFTCIFIIEAILRIFALRLGYFMHSWNLFDFVIVVLSIIGE